MRGTLVGNIIYSSDGGKGGQDAVVLHARGKMATHKYSPQELSILRNLFDSVDLDRSGRIHVNQLPGLCTKLGKNQGARAGRSC